MPRNVQRRDTVIFIAERSGLLRRLERHCAVEQRAGTASARPALATLGDEEWLETILRMQMKRKAIAIMRRSCSDSLLTASQMDGVFGIDSGHKPRILQGAHADWLRERIPHSDFTLRPLERGRFDPGRRTRSQSLPPVREPTDGAVADGRSDLPILARPQRAVRGGRS